jgi:PAS domain S-box-containing protein
MTTQPPSREDVPADASWAAQPIRAAELEELLVHGAAAVIATDLDGVITHWNAGAQRLYGWSGTETIGLPFLELLVAPGDRRTAEANMESIRRTGSLLTYTRCAVIKDDAGRLVGMLGLSMDAAAPPRQS